MKHDKLFPPSSMPMREKCLHFSSNPTESTEAADQGTLQHKYIELLLKRDVLGEEISDDEIMEVTSQISKDGLDDAYTGYELIVNKFEEIKKDDPVAQLLTESEVTIFASDFTTTTGTVDIAILGKGLHIMDYKSGQYRSYAGQLKTYALGAMQLHKYDSCTYHIVYGKQDDITSSDITLEDAQCYFDDMISAIKTKESADKHPTDYCSWCEHSTSCDARTKPLAKLVGTEMITVNGDLKDTTDSILENTLAMIEVVEKFKKEVVKEMERRIEDGVSFDRYEMKSSAPRKSVSNVPELLNRGFKAEEILELATLSVSNLMKLIYGDDARKKASKEHFEEEFSSLVSLSVPKSTLKVRK